MRHVAIAGLAASLAFGLGPVGVFSTASAQSAAPDPVQVLRVRALAATCAQCHGTDGRPPPGSAVPGLAGQAASYLTQQMTAFKNGTRPGTVMPQLAKGYDDAQVEGLARYFAQLSPAAPP